MTPRSWPTPWGAFAPIWPTISGAWAEGDRTKAAARISDDMLENIAVFGDAATCRAKLEQFRRNGADMPIVSFPHGSPPTAVRRTLEALAPKGASGFDPPL